MRVTVVENTSLSRLGAVGVALDEVGADVNVIRAFRGDELPPDPDHPDAPDALVVLGGEQNAVADDLHPYLPRLASLMRRYGETGKGVLGICLGSQILARGLGATNLIGTAPEFGWCEVALTDAGRSDPVLAAAGDLFPIFQWHDDNFTAPPGAAHLATSDRAAQQAFRFGRAAYGTQFHFEANRDVVAEWVDSFGDLIERRHPGWIDRYRTERTTTGVAADAAGLAIARAWVAGI